MARIVPEGGWGSRLKPFKTPRVKSRGHLDFIKALPCVCCWADRAVQIQADDPMHIRASSPLHGKEPAGGGQTSDDRWTLPGCRRHHDEQHASGNELGFWMGFGIDPFLLALVLWGLTGDDWAASEAIRQHVHARPAKLSDTKVSI
jgi:hypothetical protein